MSKPFQKLSSSTRLRLLQPELCSLVCSEPNHSLWLRTAHWQKCHLRLGLQHSGQKAHLAWAKPWVLSLTLYRQVWCHDHHSGGQGRRSRSSKSFSINEEISPLAWTASEKRSEDIRLPYSLSSVSVTKEEFITPSI